jgi:hypothetical protein
LTEVFGIDEFEGEKAAGSSNNPANRAVAANQNTGAKGVMQHN